MSPEANFARMGGFDLRRSGVFALGGERWASLPETLQSIADDAARSVNQLPNDIAKQLPPECWRSPRIDMRLWVSVVFGLAWSPAHGSPLRAVRLVPLNDRATVHLESVPDMKDWPLQLSDEQIAAVMEKGWYSTLDDFAVASVQAVDVLMSWLDDVPKRATEVNRTPPKPKQTRHRRTNEELFKAALRTHHKYETGGSVLNMEPASTRRIEELSGKGVSDSTAGRLLKKHFGSVEQYRVACFSRAIRDKLVVLLGDALHAYGSFDASRRDVEDQNDSDSDE